MNRTIKVGQNWMDLDLRRATPYFQILHIVKIDGVRYVVAQRGYRTTKIRKDRLKQLSRTRGYIPV